MTEETSVTAGSSSSSSTFLQPPGPQLMPIQLTYYNYLLWKSLFVPVLEAYDILNLAEGREQCPPQFLSTSEDDNKQGSIENPAYSSWIKRDKMFLTWINASLSPNLLRHTKGCTSGQALWLHLENLLAQSAESLVLQLKACLQNLDARRFQNAYSYNIMKKYFDYAGEIAYELEKAGSPVDERELISHIIEGLHPPYDELVSSIMMNRPLPITRQELRDLVETHECRRTLKRKNRVCCIKFLSMFFGFVLIATPTFYFTLRTTP